MGAIVTWRLPEYQGRATLDSRWMDTREIVMPVRAAPCILMALLLALSFGNALAEVRTKTVRYQDGNVELRGHLAWDDAIKGKRPGVIVVHEWWGLNDYARRRAEMLARLGYAAFAVDMYGKDKVTEHGSQASEWM